MPRAVDAPMFAVVNHPVPAKTNPLGVKGCGEAGCAGSLTSIMNAVVDALSDYGIRHIDMPATPHRVWQAIRRGERRHGRPERPQASRNKKATMTQAVELPLRGDARAARRRLVASVCFAHFVSHYYMLLLAPLFMFVREDFGVSYTELGLALTAFNVVSTVMQTPAGFLVDRVERAHHADRGPAARRRRVRGRGPGQLVLGVRRDVRGRWASATPSITRPTTRCCRAARPGRARRTRVLLPHLLRHDRQRGRAGDAVYSAEPSWAGAAPSSAPPRSASSPRSSVLLTARAAGAVKPVDEDAQGRGRPTRRSTAGGSCSSPPILLNLVFFILLSMSGGGLNNYLVVDARRAARHAGGGRQHRADRAPDHERGRRAGRRRAHRLHLAPRPGRRDRPAVQRRSSACWSASIDFPARWC